MRNPRLESFDAFGEEGEAAPRLSIVEWPAGQDPLAEFTEEPAAPQTAASLEPLEPLEPLESLELLEPSRTYRTPRAYQTLRAYRPPRSHRTSRTLLALCGLAAVAVISVIALNSLSDRVAVDPPGDVAALNQPASPSPNPAIEPAPPVPQPVSTSVPLPAAPRAETPRAESPRAAAAVSERSRPIASGSASARTATPQRVTEPPRPIAPPNRESPPVQRAAVPAPVATRAVDTTQAPMPPATATTGVRATESVQGPRLDPPAVAAPGAPPSAPVVASPLPTPPAAASTAAAAEPAPAPLPVPARVVTATDAIQSVLGRYASAFSALDAGGAKAVWPSVNERNLARAFESLEQQEFDLGACAITVTAPRAVASCRGTARYTPRVGNRRMRTESRQWTFRLEAQGETWSIASVDSR